MYCSLGMADLCLTCPSHAWDKCSWRSGPRACSFPRVTCLQPDLSFHSTSLTQGRFTQCAHWKKCPGVRVSGPKAQQRLTFPSSSSAWAQCSGQMSFSVQGRTVWVLRDFGGSSPCESPPCTEGITVPLRSGGWREWLPQGI